MAKQKNVTNTFFYVFIRIETVEDRLKIENTNEIKSSAEALDNIIRQAFIKFKDSFEGETRVVINPVQFHELRQLFDIKKLPAFGVYNKLLTSNAIRKLKPEKVPGILEVWNWGKRKRILDDIEKNNVFPMVERNILEQFKNTESIYNFICDLHLANIDNGLLGVVTLIDNKVNEIRGKKIIEDFKTGKDFVKKVF